MGIISSILYHREYRQKGENMKENKGQFRRNMFIVTASMLCCLLLSIFAVEKSTNITGNIRIELKKSTYSEFLRELENEKFEKVTVKGNTITAWTKEQDGVIYEYILSRMEDPELVERLISKDVEFDELKDNSAIIWNVISLMIPIGFFLYLFKGIKKGGGIMGVGKSNAKLYDVQKSTGILFKDVAGEDEAKESLMEIVDFLHNPGKYNKIGAKLPKGALLVGPPGTGKTMLAKAIAGEAKVPFYSLSGSDFVEMFVGVGASRVRDLFQMANKSAPCIIFIDEIDAIGKSRDGRLSGNDEREQTLNQLLSEMDGFDPSKGIIVLGATNRPEILDPALLRPGRFDRRIVVEKPDLKGRIDILKVHSKNVPLDDTINLKEVALSTSGVSGADLANIVNEAAINAAKNDKLYVSQKDLLEAVEIVLVGKEKKDRVLSEEEKKIVAYHEIGHALAAAVRKDAEPVQKITIIPRTMGALGYVMQVPEKEKYLNTKDELKSQIVISLAGRAAEEIFFDMVTTGASNDIEKATSIARAMVTQYGMSDKFGLAGFATAENRYLSEKTSLNCGDLTAAEIDKEVIVILKDAYKEAKCLIEGHKSKIKELSEFLIEKETITGKEFMDIFQKDETVC